jgi:hypothetical protein
MLLNPPAGNEASFLEYVVPSAYEEFIDLSREKNKIIRHR